MTLEQTRTMERLERSKVYPRVKLSHDGLRLFVEYIETSPPFRNVTARLHGNGSLELESIERY